MEPWLDRAASRRGFDAASGTDALAREIEIRLAERLQYVKLSPARIVDAASGAGASRTYLRAQ
ncbi:MAG TPA: SAM-dependent methyltransferase, partial [Burkholderiales bacterium]|nr:SAM-dependent methyltransferase [Burkholderiales bacterium]